MRKKKHQRLSYEPGQTINKPPQWRSKLHKRPHEEVMEAESSAATKRQKIDSAKEQELMTTLQKTLRFRIKKEITQAIKDKKNIPLLKVEMECRKQLPRGTFTAVEKEVGVESSTMDKLMKRRKEKPIAHYVQFVTKEFDKLHVEVKEELDEAGLKRPAGSDDTSSASPSNIQETEETEDDEDFDEVDDELKMRTVSHPFMSLIREDLSEDMKKYFLDTLEDTMSSSSDYIIAYAIRVQQIMMLFKSYAFQLHTDSTVIMTPKAGCLVKTIFPPNFPISDDNSSFPPTLEKLLLDDQDFAKDFDNLFNSSHLQFLHSDYFGSKSSRRKGSFPCRDALKNAFPFQQKNKETSEPYAMKLALSRYMNNFQNLWSNSKRYYKLLNNVLIVLLRIHLAPEREQAKREYAESKMNAKANKPLQDNESPTVASISKRSYNERKKLFKNEKRKCDKYRKKAECSTDIRDIQKWNDKVIKCESRLKLYEETLKNQV